MKFTYLFLFFVVFIFSSCSDLDISKIKCENSYKCPSDSICHEKACLVCPSGSVKNKETCDCGEGFVYNVVSNVCVKSDTCDTYNDCDDSSICYGGICRTCVDGSTKSGSTCLCTDTNTYYYKEKNRCDSFICVPENAKYATRPDGCQDGFGYCIKEEGETNGTCKPNTCTSHLDCNQGQQCAFSEGEDNLIFLTCQDIGVVKIEEECNKLNNNCELGLSCLEDDENKMTCQEICIPGNETEISSCSEEKTCVDYANFNSNVPIKLIGACLGEGLICNFTSSQYNVINDASCNDSNGTCVRQDLDNSIGFCLADECNPTASECAEEQKCVFNGQTYKCKDENTSATGVDGASCQYSLECNTGLTCIKDGDNDDKHCRRLCRPNNLYSYDDCLSLQQCTDLNSMVPEFAENVVGFCQVK